MLVNEPGPIRKGFDVGLGVFATAYRFLNQFGHPWSVTTVKGHPRGESHDGRDGAGNVDGDPAVAKRGVGDVQVPEGFGEDGIEPDSTG